MTYKAFDRIKKSLTKVKAAHRIKISILKQKIPKCTSYTVEITSLFPSSSYVEYKFLMAPVCTYGRSPFFPPPVPEVTVNRLFFFSFHKKRESSEICPNIPGIEHLHTCAPLLFAHMCPKTFVVLSSCKYALLLCGMRLPPPLSCPIQVQQACKQTLPSLLFVAVLGTELLAAKKCNKIWRRKKRRDEKKERPDGLFCLFCVA